MMNRLLIALVFFSLTSSAQTTSFQRLLDAGKAEFKSAAPNYQKAADSLKAAIKLQPGNAEAHYFLGYAYSRINAADGTDINTMRLALTQQSSAALEKVNKLAPLYQGELVALGPYAKITSEWGSMAMSYYNRNKIDSAVWAFAEGKRRGGFGYFVLAVNRQVLAACSKNSILISSGDTFTIPLWYLQMVEKVRPDVSVVDVSLLNTLWYPKLLSKKNVVHFAIPDNNLDQVDYMRWSDSTITINRANGKSFAWVLQPSFQKAYILRGDRLLVSLLQANQFKRDVYFTTAFMPEMQLSLEQYLGGSGMVDKLLIENTVKAEPDDAQKAEILQLLSAVKLVNKNNKDDLGLANIIRTRVLYYVQQGLDGSKLLQVREVLRALDKAMPEKDYPFATKAYADYVNELKAKYL